MVGQNGVGWEINFSVDCYERVVMLTPFLIQRTLIDLYVGKPIQLPYILTQGMLYSYPSCEEDYKTFCEKVVGIKYNPGYFELRKHHFGGRFISLEFLTPLGIEECKIEMSNVRCICPDKCITKPNKNFDDCFDCNRSNAKKVVADYFMYGTSYIVKEFVITFMLICDTCFEYRLEKRWYTAT
jgi:hypothetical protein